MLFRSKKAAEEYILAGNSDRIKTTIIRPGNVYGPGDTTTFFRIFEAIERGIMGYIDGGNFLTCPVYIDDLVDAVIAAYEKPESAGKVFNITGGEKVTWRQLMEYSARLLDKKPPGLSLPAPVARFIARLLEMVFTIVRSRTGPPLTLYRVDHIAHNYHFSIDRAKQVLGFVPKTTWKHGFEKSSKNSDFKWDIYYTY